MTNPARFNPRNKALGEANTLLILASLKNGPRTMTELITLTGLTRQTIVKKISQNSELVRVVEDSFPKKYYVGEAVDTITTENTTPDKPKRSDAVKAAIVSDQGVVFFPKATHHDHSRFHDHILNSEEDNPFMNMYRGVDTKTKLTQLEHEVKTMYDLIQFRKTLKEFE